MKGSEKNEKVFKLYNNSFTNNKYDLLNANK